MKTLHWSTSTRWTSRRIWMGSSKSGKLLSSSPSLTRINSWRPCSPALFTSLRIKFRWTLMERVLSIVTIPRWSHPLILLLGHKSFLILPTAKSSRWIDSVVCGHTFCPPVYIQAGSSGVTLSAPLYIYSGVTLSAPLCIYSGVTLSAPLCIFRQGVWSHSLWQSQVETLFRCTFWSYYHVQSTVMQYFRYGWVSYSLSKLMNTWHVYTVSMSPTRNRSTVLRHFERAKCQWNV